MHIPDFSAFSDIISHHELIQIKRTSDLFHFKLKFTFSDTSVLYARENHLPAIDWHEYSYQWQTIDHGLIHRWDNAHERHVFDIPPHHQHIGSEENVHPSEPMTLEKVLTFIASQLLA